MMPWVAASAAVLAQPVDVAASQPVLHQAASRYQLLHLHPCSVSCSCSLRRVNFRRLLTFPHRRSKSFPSVCQEEWMHSDSKAYCSAAPEIPLDPYSTLMAAFVGFAAAVVAEPENGATRPMKVVGSGSGTSQEGIERSYEEKGKPWIHLRHPGTTAEVCSAAIAVAASLGSDLGTAGSSPLEPAASTSHHPDPSAAVAAAAGPAVVAVADDVVASVAGSAAAAAASAPSSRVPRLPHSSPCFPRLRLQLGSELRPA